MTQMQRDALLTQLGWRYATRAFDATRRISHADWDALEETLRLAPSSYGMQPWYFLVVENEELRKRLMAASWDQPQVVEASHFVVFAGLREIRVEEVDRLISKTVEVRGVPVESLVAYRQHLVEMLIEHREGFSTAEWSARQVYLALGSFLTAAAVLGIDTCPMEGFEPAEYDRILGLEGTGYRSVVAAAAGFRSKDDVHAGYPKVRYERSHVFKYVK